MSQAIYLSQKSTTQPLVILFKLINIIQMVGSKKIMGKPLNYGQLNTVKPNLNQLITPRPFSQEMALF